VGPFVGVLDQFRDLDRVEERGHRTGPLPGVLGPPQQETQVTASPVPGPQIEPGVQLLAQSSGHAALHQRRVLLVGGDLP
jgi:hypothetical protein